MKTLIYYEKKKILKRTSTIVTCLMMLLCIAALNILFISDQFYFTEDDAEVCGLDAIHVEREMNHALAGPLTTERIKAILHQYQAAHGNADNYTSAGALKNEVYCKEVLPYNGVLNLMRQVYSPAGTYDYEILSSVTDEMAEQFYEIRHAQVQSILHTDNAAEKEAALRLDSSVSAPIAFDDSGGWSTLLVRAFALVFLLVGLAVCVTISPVFASEYQTGADAVVLSSRYGRRETVWAKIAAGFLVTSGIYLIAVFASFGGILGVFGTLGWNCDYQLLSITSIYPLKIWQVVLFGSILNYAVILSIMAFTMLLSAICKTPFVAVIISILCTAAPLFFPTSSISGFLQKLICLLPAKAMDTHAVFSSYIPFSIGKAVIPLPCMILISACTVLAVMLPAAKRRFCRHQAG